MLTMPDGYIDACAGRNFHTITSLSSRVVHGVGRIPQMKISPLFTALSTHFKKFILLCSVQIDFFSCCPSREIESGKLNLRKKRKTQLFRKLFGNINTSTTTQVELVLRMIIRLRITKTSSLPGIVST